MSEKVSLAEPAEFAEILFKLKAEKNFSQRTQSAQRFFFNLKYFFSVFSVTLREIKEKEIALTDPPASPCSHGGRWPAEPAEIFL